MPLTVAFELTGPGWMDIHLARGDESFHLAGLSYLTPVLDDVLIAAIRIATGDWRADALFELEPGAQRLRFERRWQIDGRHPEYFVSAAKSNLDLVFQEIPEDSFTLQWELAIDGFDEIAAAILEGARALEAKHGHDGYAREWVEHPFPVRAIAALEAALNTAPLPPLDPNLGCDWEEG